MSTRYAVVRVGRHRILSSTHRYRWLAQMKADSMNNIIGVNSDHLKAADSLGLVKPDAIYVVEEYEA